MKVIGEGQLIIENVDGIDECADDLALIICIIDIPILKTGDPIHDLGPGVAWALNLSLCDAQLEALFLFLQLFQSFFGGFGENAHLNSVKHILNSLLAFR